MKTTISRIAALVLLATFVTAGAAEAARIYVRIGPPPLIVESRPVPAYAGLVWLPGYYAWTGVGYAWVPGRWVAAPYRHAHWVAGRWVYSRRGYYWDPGRWRRYY